MRHLVPLGRLPVPEVPLAHHSGEHLHSEAHRGELLVDDFPVRPDVHLVEVGRHPLDVVEVVPASVGGEGMELNAVGTGVGIPVVSLAVRQGGAVTHVPQPFPDGQGGTELEPVGVLGAVLEEEPDGSLDLLLFGECQGDDAVASVHGA